MNIQHKELAAGRWREMTLMEQLANIGSEVDRAFRWREKKNTEYCLKAVDRALELFDLTLDCVKEPWRQRELRLARGEIADFFYGTNEFNATEASIRRYYLQFAFAARRNK